MDKDIKALWVKALRSGDYSLGVEALKDHRGCFCIMGVLSDLYIKENDGLAFWEENTTGGGYKFKTKDGKESFSLLNTVVFDWAGLNQDSFINVLVKKDNPLYSKVYKALGFSKEEDIYCSLMVINDTEEFTFEELADLIEASEL